MTGKTGPAGSAMLTLADEEELRSMLSGSLSVLRGFPFGLELAFRRHLRRGSANLLRSSIYLLFAIYFVVVGPVALLNHDPLLPTWEMITMLPIGLVLVGIWLTSRFEQMDRYVETTLGISLFICLVGTIYCAMLLGSQYFGLMSSYETIYILIIAFSILRLPALLAFQYTLAAFVVALSTAIWHNVSPPWFNLLLYVGVPVIICTVNGFMLEYSERRNYLQNQLLNMESARLADMRHQAEAAAEKQQINTRYLELIAGNLSVSELCSRTLRFLISETESVVGSVYIVQGKGRLRLASQWGGDPRKLDQRKDIPAQETLIGPALQARHAQVVTDIPEGHLPIRLGSGDYRPGTLLIVPVFHNDNAVAALELARFTAYPQACIELADAIATHFAYAMTAAMARERISNHAISEAS